MAIPTAVQINPDNSASVRYDDGELVQRFPGADLSDLPADMQAQVNAAWTPQVIADWNLKQAQATLSAAADAQLRRVRTRGHAFTTGPLAGHSLKVEPFTDDQANWLTLFTYALDEVNLGNGAQPCPEPIIDASGAPVTGVTWQNALDAMRELRQWGFAAIGVSIAMKEQGAACTSAAQVQAIDPTQGWPN